MRGILGDLDAAAFLERHWQKKPLLVRRALPGFESPLDADELAGLACEEDIESRLIEKSGDRYRVENGPFDAKRLAKLPRHDWTLLVQDVEKHLPDFAACLDRFDFIPGWRIDDLMISVASTGGGVGPHVDAYDVFLLQAKGRRRWSIAERFDPGIIAGMDLRVLEHFQAEQEWILEPGDMLYLPPNVAHDGVALDDDCMTWSIGFRAPSLRDMFSDFSEWIFQRLPEDSMYADPDLAPGEAAGGSISPDGLRRMRQLLRGALSPADIELDRWFGEFMTEPKPWLQCEQPPEPMDVQAFEARLMSDDALMRDSRARLAWLREGDANRFFVNGASHSVQRALEPLLHRLCTTRHIEPGDIAGMPRKAAIAILHALHAEGVLHFSSAQEAEHG